MTALSADQVPEEWSVIASSYEQAFEGLSSQFAAEALRLLNLKPGERLIDVAAGTGALSLMAARAGAEVLATDFAPGMVARLRERAASARLSGLAAEVMDGQALTVPDGSFDASVSVLGLIFFPDIPKGMSELKRVVREGGRSAIVCWGDVTKLELMSLVMRAIVAVAPELQASVGPPVWARLSGEDALRTQMQRAGFRDVEVTTVSGSLRIESPRSFWPDFASSAPPLAYLFERLGPDRTAAVGQVFFESLGEGAPIVGAEACIGIGRV
jgi:ubiquinone/menaquinone biosynthesis C-methylase UbiE